MLRKLCLLAALLFTFATPEARAVDIKDPENTLIIELRSGEVVIEMLPDVAPGHVDRIKKLTRDGEYDNVAFHRVIEGFMAQTGDVQFGDMEDGYNPSRTGTGGSDLADLKAEFSSVPFDRGVVGMARAQNPNSGNSQFFIMFDDGHFLNNQYTVWGRVIDGMEHVDNIKRGAPGSGAVTDPDRMIKVTVAADR
ncbi:peptidylprolyl isomerase [Limibaculum sp. M0105]|uniref:Peptidyl-prolyl cis-trans isomerase n=2 Tax=Thermohalobaculum xanthum TaxID=2753746 RepID=A0A8J7M7W9_9RHOB|nr:peptidylprolyl isomerase [Thermohalobaculum xanthum]MBK0399360.1 peptidylprolyl isomerase [Thermohalobaculum xanthum]